MHRSIATLQLLQSFQTPPSLLFQDLQSGLRWNYRSPCAPVSLRRQLLPSIEQWWDGTVFRVFFQKKCLAAMERIGWSVDTSSLIESEKGCNSFSTILKGSGRVSIFILPPHPLNIDS
mmetsp:Transcript_25228/g.69576  ORF Transcript_25228/g.69576 Transcript_25228/m.69576 type:complete len:118 (+) Transcript_25228:1197-1550(+)